MTARAETLEPVGVQYDVELKQDSVGAVCYLLVLISNLPKSPEAVKFAMTVAFAKGTGQAYTGFIVDVGDLKFDSGVPTGMTKAPLSSAEFFSSGFNSPGRMYGGAISDGGFQMSSNDPPTEAAFLSSVMAGDFLVQFTRKGAPASRAYHVAAGPGADVIGKFGQCTEQILPH